MNQPTGQILANRGFSKLFTCDVVVAWASYFGEDPVTVEDLLNDGGTSYIVMRAAGVSDPMFGRTRKETSRVALWLEYFSKNPMPTHDGLNDYILVPTTSVGSEAWILKKRAPRAAAA